MCLLIGCTREQLEDRKFKKKPLGAEWIIYKGEHGDRLRTQEWIDNNIAKHLDPLTYGWIKVIMTPRKLMQLIGTEAGRNILHPNIWVNALFADYKSINSEGTFYNEKLKTRTACATTIYPNWVITDVRFPNEVRAIKDRGGVVIRVNRPNKAYITSIDNSTNTVLDKYHKTKLLKPHFSEIALDNYKDWDHVVYNNGTIKDLICKIKEIYV